MPFWAIMQPVVVIPYRYFGATYRSHLKGGLIGCLEKSKAITITHCVIAQKNTVVIHFMAEA
jgi:hypothetical protein